MEENLNVAYRLRPVGSRVRPPALLPIDFDQYEDDWEKYAVRFKGELGMTSLPNGWTGLPLPFERPKAFDALPEGTLIGHYALGAEVSIWGIGFAIVSVDAAILYHNIGLLGGRFMRNAFKSVDIVLNPYCDTARLVNAIVAAVGADFSARFTDELLDGWCGPVPSISEQQKHT